MKLSTNIMPLNLHISFVLEPVNAVTSANMSSVRTSDMVLSLEC
jgi:hypothetical protein